MKIASNKIVDLVRFYREQLAPIYEPGELQAIIELAFEHYIGFSRQDLQTRTEETVNQSDLIRIYDACKALATGEPLQYVLGVAEFYGLHFQVNPSVLIPRPETEELVDLILKDLKETHDKLYMLDIGTGSGCIPVSLKKHRPSAALYGLDVSEDALKTAASNATLNKVNVSWVHQNILEPISGELPGTPYDVIASNPPYIQSQEATEMTTQVKDHEPHLALFVDGPDAILFYKRIIDFCQQQLKPAGRLYFELNPLTAGDVKAYAEQSGLFEKTEILRDMSGKDRFLKAIKRMK